MANEMRLIDANALCEFFQERYKYLRNASEKQLPNGNVQVDLEIQCGAIIAKEFLDKAKEAPTVDAVEVPDKKLLKAINLLIKQYEHSKNSDYVHSPVAHAFYYTWKQLDAKMDGDGNG